MNNLLTCEGDAHSTTAGRYSVNVINNGTAAGQHLYRVTVTNPGFCPSPAFDRDHDRPFGHPDQEEAQKIAEHYARGVIDLLNFEQGGIPDERIAEVAQQLNADADGYVAAERAVAAKLDADMQEAAGEEDGWYAARKQARHAVVPTRTNVHCKPLTVVEQDLIRTHQDGRVATRAGQAWTVLQAIVRRGFGTAVYGAGRRIVAIELNQRGLAAAAEQPEVAA